MVAASGGTLVLMDYAAENIATDYLAVDGGRGRGAGEWLVEMETAMRPGFVVMAEVLGEQRLEMSSRHDEEVIEALLADGPHEPLGESVRPRRGDRGSQGLSPDGGEHGVEDRGELGVAVADEEAEVTPGVLEVRRKVAGNLVTQGPLGLEVTPNRCTRRRSISITKSTQKRRSVIVSTVKKSVAKMPLAWACTNSLQVGPERRGAGGRRRRARTAATLVLATATLSFFSSPTMHR